MRPVRTILEDYDWIHTGVGLLGNLLFVVGSVLFLWESTKDVGVWVFIAGSSFMFAGSAGDASIKVGTHLDHLRRDEKRYSSGREAAGHGADHERIVPERTWTEGLGDGRHGRRRSRVSRGHG